MKRLTLLAIMALSLAGCNSGGSEQPTNTNTTTAYSPSGFIPVDSANKMISSYLNSINASGNDSEIRSIIFNADSLRVLLNNDSNGKVANVKLMFAHTLEYINSGGADQRCGYQSGDFTIIIAGYDEQNNYVFYPTGKVPDNGMPCPTSCPLTGTAANDLLPVSSGEDKLQSHPGSATFP